MLDYHILYFLPALIVYGIWTWYSWTHKDSDIALMWTLGHFLTSGVILITIFYFYICLFVKYFTN